MDRKLTNVSVRDVQADQIWPLVGKKEKSSNLATIRCSETAIRSRQSKLTASWP